MKMQQQFVLRDNYLEVAVRGSFNIREAKSLYLEILTACARQDVQKVLLDDRAVKGGGMSTTERFDLVEFMVAEEWKMIAEHRLRPLKIAIVGKAPLVEGNDFAETVASNRGGNIRGHLDLKEALEWLKEV